MRRDPIETCHVHRLVHQHRLPSISRPGVGVERNDDRRSQHTDGGRDLNVGAREEAYRSSAPDASTRFVEEGYPVGIGHRPRVSNRPRDAPQSVAKVEQRKRCANRPDGHQPRLPTHRGGCSGGFDFTGSAHLEEHRSSY
jgi:hypothetical protein